MEYCYDCGVNHRKDCPKKRDMVECPRCSKKSKIDKDDYVCSSCREELTPKFTISIPESQITSLKEKEAITVIQTMLRNGIGFVVAPEET